MRSRPLRVKLIAGLLLLVVLALTMISVAGISVLRGYLVGRADVQLGQAAASVVSQLNDDVPLNRLRLPAEVAARVLDEKGAVVGTSDPLGDSRSPKTPDELGSTPVTVGSAEGRSGDWRIEGIALDGGGQLVLAVSMDEIDRTINRLMLIDLVVSAATLTVLAVAGAAIVRASLRPLREIEETAEAIAAGDLSLRAPDADPDTEVGRLGRAFNTMLTQIETAFAARAESEATARQSEERMRRFVADASHELRTPLTAIRGFAELHRQNPQAEVIAKIESAASRMGLLVEDLLLLARMDQQRPLARTPVDLLSLAVEAVQEARIIAPDREIDLSVAGAAYQVLGDEPKLRQVFANLLSNALTHTPAGTPVQVRLRPEPGQVVLEVADQGPGLTPTQVDHVFDRFYQADTARQESGTGLGLAIVAALVEAHGGRVSVAADPGAGAVFRVTLPEAP
ncbi:MAG: HAMP domain-containing sensor histidine kinase [Streptosporangiaceae bacterium]